MTKYRVYIKEAKPDLLIKGLQYGTLNGQNGEFTENYSYLATEYYIPVDTNHKYELVNLTKTKILYYICEYDINNVYIRNTHTPYGSTPMQDRSGTEVNINKIYIPSSEQVAFVRIQITNGYSDYADQFMFLESVKPYLIHDSMSPNKEDHLLECTLHLEECSSGSLDFTIWPGHNYYSKKINIWTDTFYVTRTYDNGSEHIIWDGRAISEDLTSDRKRTYHCEGALSYLNDYRVKNSRYGSNRLTVAQLFDEYIISPQSRESNQYGRIDRSFYHSKDNGSLVEGVTVYCDSGIAQNFNLNYESGLKWVQDIKEAFSGHYKVRYRPYDSPNDDVICRCFTYIQDFEQFIVLENYGRLSNGIIKKGSIFYYIYGGKFFIYEVTDDFNKTGNILTAQIILEKLIKKEAAYSSSEDNTNDSHEYWNIRNEYAIRYLNSNRYQKIYAKFGSDIFDASKTTEINNFATCILPKGVQGTNNQDETTNLYLTTTSINIDGKPRTFPNYFRLYNSDYINDYSLMKKYGIVAAVVSFEGANTPTRLYNQAQVWFRNLKKNLIKTNISITLSGLCKIKTGGSGDPFSDKEYIDLWTKVYATIPEIGITEDDPELYYVSSLDIPLDDYMSTSINLVNHAEMMSEQIISGGDIKGASPGIIDTSS